MKRALHGALAGWMALSAPASADTGWPQYGGDQGGQRYSSAVQITPANVSQLHQAWSYSTGAMTAHAHAMSEASFEDTPILDEGKLFVCSPFYEVMALDPGRGGNCGASIPASTVIPIRGIRKASNAGALPMARAHRAGAASIWRQPTVA
jgi:hypothetical protein